MFPSELIDPALAGLAVGLSVMNSRYTLMDVFQLLLVLCLKMS